MNGLLRYGALALACSLVACGDDTTTATGTGDAGSDPTETDSDPSGTTGSQSSSDGDSADVGSGGANDSSSTAAEPEFIPYPARGIRIAEMYANQGVGVPILRDGAWVDGSGRNASLVRNRNTLIRGYWEFDEGFEPREIQARLTLRMPDGTEEIAERVFDVQGESRPAEINTNMYFVVPGELLPVGVQFKVELFETQYGYEDLPEPSQTSFPPQFGFVGTEDRDMALKVVLVPVRHDTGNGCPEAPEVTDDELQSLSDQLFMQNPVERVEMELREPVTYQGSLNSFSPLLSFMADLRASDNADPAAYYYGVVRPCDGGPDGVGGQAISIPDFPTIDNAWTRTSVGRWYAGLGSTANTFVHEVGHTQGRRHVFCNGEEGGADPSYPYDAGDIGVWGFGVLDFTLHTPTNGKDYMTYCGNTWVSDWTWERVSPVIQEITSWGAENVAPQPSGRVLVGLIDPTAGVESWFVTPGSAQGITTTGAEPMHLQGPGGIDLDLQGVYGPMGDGDSYVVAAPLPEHVSIDDRLQVTREHEGQQLRVDSIRTNGKVLTLAQE